MLMLSIMRDKALIFLTTAKGQLRSSPSTLKAFEEFGL